MFLMNSDLGPIVNRGFLIENGRIYCQINNSLKKIELLTSNLIKENSFEEKIDFQRIERLNTYLACFTTGQISFFDDNFILKKIFESEYYEYQLFAEFFIIRIIKSNYVENIHNLVFHDLREGIDLWEIETNEQIKFHSDFLFFVSPKVIRMRDFNNGESIWHLEIENALLFPELIGVSNKIAIFGLQKVDRLIAVNVDTGKVIWEKRAITSGKLIDCEKGVLHSFLVNYTQLSIETGDEISSCVNRDYFETSGIETNRSNFVLIGDHIITTDGKRGNIGAFNTITLKFDWLYTIEGVSLPAVFPVVYQDGYLCVLDNKQTLHIFEKENY